MPGSLSAEESKWKRFSYQGAKGREPKNSPSKETRKGPKKRPGSDADGASFVAEAMADAAAELKAHSSNGADVEAAPKETSGVMTEVWKRRAENASNLEIKMREAKEKSEEEMTNLKRKLEQLEALKGIASPVSRHQYCIG